MEKLLLKEILDLSEVPEIKELLERDLYESDRIYAIQRQLMPLIINEDGIRMHAETVYIIAMLMILAKYLNYDPIEELFPDFDGYTPDKDKLELYGVICDSSKDLNPFEMFNSYIFIKYFNQEYVWQQFYYDSVSGCTQISYLECRISCIRFENHPLYDDITEIRKMIE